MTIKSANPGYGLNALGGAVIFATKTGRTAPGLRVGGTDGRYGRAEANAEAGWAGEHASAYVAVSENHDDRWWRFSPAKLNNDFAELYSADKAAPCSLTNFFVADDDGERCDACT